MEKRPNYTTILIVCQIIGIPSEALLKGESHIPEPLESGTGIGKESKSMEGCGVRRRDAERFSGWRQESMTPPGKIGLVQPGNMALFFSLGRVKNRWRDLVDQDKAPIYCTY